MTAYTLIDSTGATTHLTHDQVAETLRVWETPEQPHAVFGRFEGCGLLFSGPCNGFMFVADYEVGSGWVEVKQGDADIMRAWLAGQVAP